MGSPKGGPELKNLRGGLAGFFIPSNFFDKSNFMDFSGRYNVDLPLYKFF
jgi:hypothetical protein